MDYLYRGVSKELFNQLNGKISPKDFGEEFPSFAQFGQEHASFGSGVTFGKSNTNEVVKHQHMQKGLKTSGVSSSPHIERARFYALSGGRSANGYIYKLSVELLQQYGVSIFRVNELVPVPAAPEDDEHVLVASDFGLIPESTIIEIIEVTSTVNML